MGKILDWLCGSMAFLAVLLIVFTTFSIGYSILTRLLPLPAILWVVQFNEYSLLWITFLGTAWVLGNNKHVSVGIVFDRLKGKSQRLMALFHNLMGMSICGVLTWYGTWITWDQYQRGVIDIQVVDFPIAYIIMVIPLGFLFLTLQFLRRFIATLQVDKNQDALLLKSAASEELPGKETAAGGSKERGN